MAKNSYHRIMLLFVSLFISSALFAQKTEISGIVKDSLTQQPIEGVVVNALDGKRIIAFGITNKAGDYKLSFQNQAQRLTVSFQHIAYHSKTRTGVNKSQQLNPGLRSKTVTLREVRVKAPDVVVKKDTISFNVASFKTAADRSIEDVIKKLPGVKVNENGGIAYQGKAISQLSIEGLDMLGGKYTLATQNVQHKDVSQVEVIENFQPIKQLQGKEPSEAVAMNLKLTKEAKSRLLGAAELGAGYRDEELLYHGALKAMNFRKKYQFLGIVKNNNFGNPLDTEVNDQFGEYYGYNIADAVINENVTSFPPVSYNRSHKKCDLMGTLNAIVKLSENNEVRVNADYINRRDSFRYDNSSSYFLGATNTVINEAQTSEFQRNSLRANVRYQHNSQKLYLANLTTFEVRGMDNRFGLVSNGNPIDQDVTSQLAGFLNRLNVYKRAGKKQYSFNVGVSYSDMPENRLSFTNVPGVTGEFSQTGVGKSFSGNGGTSFGYDLGRYSRLSIGTSIRVDYNKVLTRLMQNDSAIENRNDGYKIVTSVSPSYRLEAPDKRRYSLTVSMPVNFIDISYKNRINRDADFSINRPFFNPQMNGFYQFSPYVKGSVSSSIGNSVGDITDFLINPIQSSYKQRSSRSGILAKTQSFSSGLSVEYKNPLSLFFANGSLSYRKTQRNILGSKTITAGTNNVGINTSGVANNNTSDNYSVSGSVDKDVRSIRTSFSLGSGYSISTSQQMRQGVKTEIEGNSFSLSPSLRTRIVEQLEVIYQMSYSQSTQKSTGYTSSNHQQSHRFSLNYNPIDPILIYSSVDFARRELTPKNFKNTQFLDAGIRYKHKKLEADLKLNNLLDTRAYSYTVLYDLDRFTYNYFLNPREVVLMLRFNL